MATAAATSSGDAMVLNFCTPHAAIYAKKYAVLIQKIYRAYHSRKYLQKFKIMPRDIQCRILFYMREQHYVENYNNKYFKSKIIKKISHSFKKKITIGYFSADFRNHAVSRLISGFLSYHNKDNFEIIGFNLNKRPDDSITNEIKKNFTEFLNVSRLSDEEIIKLSQKYKIDIAIDLMGHTISNRLNIFFQRVAPIQVSFLGYPGTVGNCMDYIIADEYLIPNIDQKFYFEKIIYMPGCYQPFSENNFVKKKNRNLNEFKNTKEKFIYCNFNNANKISPTIFTSWMKILIKTKNTILCLLENNQISKRNLLNEAKKRGVNSDRIIFSPYYNYEIHTSRYGLCNLFLDTFPYTSHTVAREALANNLPLLSMTGKSFQSRVSSSLLKNLGLTELIVNDINDYEKNAIMIANNDEIYDKIKKKLVTSQKNETFSNSKNFCKNLENAYKNIYKRYLNNLKPSNFYVKDYNIDYE
jgi:predicted O-linked N-acetylglucosamine transferase (SPINDLY family)